MISVSVTSYNRFDLTIKSFENIIGNPKINQIIISDDCSPDDSGRKLKNYFDGRKYFDGKNENVKVMIQAQNRGMSLNKYMAIAMASNPFVLILDSDNIVDSSYLNALPDELDAETIYMPDFASPNFDYRKFAGMIFDKSNIKEFISDPMGNCCANTCNYVVNRDKYMEVYQKDESVKETDTIHFLYLWLKAGYKFTIVPGMQYFHRVHDQSGWLQNANYNMKKGEEIRNKILEL